MEKIMARVRKLLTLAENGGATEAESARAMEKVHELLAQHNLDLESIEVKEVSSMGELYEQVVSTDLWRHWIWHEVSDVYFCQYFVLTKRLSGKYRMVVGAEHNRVTVKHMVDYLITTIERTTKQTCKGQGRSTRSAFAKGMASQIAIRLRRMKAERLRKETNTSDGKQLPALLNVYEKAYEDINKRLDELNIPDGPKERNKEVDVDPLIFMLGQEAGESVSLEPQVTAQPQPVARLG